MSDDAAVGEGAVSGAAAREKWRRDVHRRLTAWFRNHARDLPWRRSPALYHVWVSEIMLQQTQVVTVVGYFNRFIARFPDVRTLAAADEQDVLRLWEGLGYYRRARQLHAAARVIVERHGGNFPTAFADVLALPGIGRYTAGAILSIGDGQRLPILEANTIRLLSRLIALRGDAVSSENQKRLWSLAEELLPERAADANVTANVVGDFNQALMEVGSLVCTPREPACSACPLARLCRTNELGLQDQIPAPKRPTRYEDVHEIAVVIRKRDRVLLRRCQPSERWAGLWDFPRFAGPATSNTSKRTGPRTQSARREAFADYVVQRTRELSGVTVGMPREMAVIKHGVTRFRITLTCVESTAVRGRARGDVQWVRVDELDDVPLSVTGRRIARLLQTAAADRLQ